MQLHPDLEARRRGAAGAGPPTGRESEVPRGEPAREDAPGGEMPGGPVPGENEGDGGMPRGAMAGGDPMSGGTNGGAGGGDMPRGDMGDATTGPGGMGAFNRVAQLLGGMPFGPATMGGSDPSDAAVASPGHATGGRTGGATGEMPAGAMDGQASTTPGAPTTAAAASGQDAGLTIQGEWRLTLSSISFGRGR